MRLLNVDSLEFSEWHGDSERPAYVIASHRWVGGFEASYKSVLEKFNTDGIGFGKVQAFASYVKAHIPSIKWLWIDTCCINKDSDAELSESINLMFKWYRNAELCLAYLADVSEDSDLERSQWFERGWTLQELLAPRVVVFVSKTWDLIGNKGASSHGYSRTSTGSGLEMRIATITGIPEQVLHDYGMSVGMRVEEKLKWMETRRTTREEDTSYALYGILGITPGANYGEGREGAAKRLLAAVNQRESLAIQRASRFKVITNWLSPADPWTNHASARERHEERTGEWFLRCDQYCRWKTGDVKHLWISGNAGCGKTVLISVAIEDIRLHCQIEGENVGFAIFYFSFSDDQKQTYENLLRSLVTQLGWKEPGLSMLQQMYSRPNASVPGVDELEGVLHSSLEVYGTVFILLDALDESPERNDIRHLLLERLQRLLRRAQNTQMLTTSRDIRDIREYMGFMSVDRVVVATQAIDADIQRYVSSEISRDARLRRLSPESKAAIEETISQKGNGMFRWAYCQLQELKKLKSTKPKYIREILRTLPATLDATYARMLVEIEPMYREEALALLQWLAYARTPPSLEQLVEVTIVEPFVRKTVDVADRGSPEDTLDILSGLVTLIHRKDEIPRYVEQPVSYETFVADDDQDVASHQRRRFSTEARVRLAHFSIKEYLESQRILESDARRFFLEPDVGHQFIAQSCLTYIIQYSISGNKTSTEPDFHTFPLLKYAGSSWFYHSSLQKGGDLSQELSLLMSQQTRRDWFFACQGAPTIYLIGEDPATSGLYFASLIGLDKVVLALLENGSDINVKEGFHGSALQAASYAGQATVVELLLREGADVDAQGGICGNSLTAAAWRGHTETVKLLLESGADATSFSGGNFGTPLQASAVGGTIEITKLLLEKGADVEAPEHGTTSLSLAAGSGRLEMVRLLLQKGATVDRQGGKWGNALCAAAHRGHAKVVALLLEEGADVDAEGGEFGNALYAAAYMGHTETVQLLVQAGADVNSRSGDCGSALCAAAQKGHTKVTSLLLEKGANISVGLGEHGYALHTAAYMGHIDTVKLLIQKGADVNARGGKYGTALCVAAYRGHVEIVKLLLEEDADVNSHRGLFSDAFEAASYHDHQQILDLLHDRYPRPLFERDAMETWYWKHLIPKIEKEAAASCDESVDDQ